MIIHNFKQKIIHTKSFIVNANEIALSNREKKNLLVLSSNQPEIFLMSGMWVEMNKKINIYRARQAEKFFQILYISRTRNAVE